MFFIEIGECLRCDRVRLSATPLADRGLEPTLLDPERDFFFANVQDSRQTVDGEPITSYIPNSEIVSLQRAAQCLWSALQSSCNLVH